LQAIKWILHFVIVGLRQIAKACVIPGGISHPWLLGHEHLVVHLQTNSQPVACGSIVHEGRLHEATP
jgi:hypothetical protein